MRADTTAFLGAALLLAITPGPDLALVTRHAMRRGFAGGFATALGTSSGLVVHAVAAALGLSAILATSATTFRAVKLVGGLYLVVIGVQALLAARREDEPVPVSTAGAPPPAAWAAYRQGLLTNLLNPKVALFFLTFLPQFVRPDDPPVARTLTLGASFVAIGLGVLTVYAASLHRLRPWLVRRRRAIEASTGLLFVGVGARLVAQPD